MLFCVICVFCLLVVLVRLSVTVQVIDWKDLVLEMTYNVLMGTLNPTHSLTHSLTQVNHLDRCCVHIQAVRCVPPSARSSTALRWFQRRFLTRSSGASPKATKSPTSRCCASERRCKAVVTATSRLRFDCNSTAPRPFDDLRYRLAAALRPK